MNRKVGYVFVWPIGTRIIHWMMALSFGAAFFTSFYEHFLHDHVAFGFIFLTIIIYRIIWGLVGPEYAKFKTFKLRPSQLKEYFVVKIKNRWRNIPAGHNPASSWFTVWALSVGFVIVASGLLLYGIQEGKGLFRGLNDNYSSMMFILDDIHKYASYLFAAWVVIHIVGVMVEQFWHKTGMVFAMITGYKRTQGEDTELKPYLSGFSYLIIIVATATYFFIVSSNYNFLTLQKYNEIDYQEDKLVFYEQCGYCHSAYPPYLLPKESWRRVMGGLKNHFGEEITEENITIAEQSTIKDYLIANAAETSKREAAVKMVHYLDIRRPKAITKTPYWRETHKDIPISAFKDSRIKKRSNCRACHLGFRYGIIDDMNIVFKNSK